MVPPRRCLTISVVQDVEWVHLLVVGRLGHHLQAAAATAAAKGARGLGGGGSRAAPAPLAAPQLLQQHKLLKAAPPPSCATSAHTHTLRCRSMSFTPAL